MTQIKEFLKADSTGKGPPRFGSYIGLVFVVGILSILVFALLHDDTGTNRAFAGLHAGMTPTEVAAVLGVPRSETSSGPQIVQTWRMPDGPVFEVTFQDGKLIKKERRNGTEPAR